MCIAIFNWERGPCSIKYVVLVRYGKVRLPRIRTWVGIVTTLRLDQIMGFTRIVVLGTLFAFECI